MYVTEISESRYLVYYLQMKWICITHINKFQYTGNSINEITPSPVILSCNAHALKSFPKPNWLIVSLYCCRCIQTSASDLVLKLLDLENIYKERRVGRRKTMFLLISKRKIFEVIICNTKQSCHCRRIYDRK